MHRLLCPLALGLGLGLAGCASIPPAWPLAEGWAIPKDYVDLQHCPKAAGINSVIQPPGTVAGARALVGCLGARYAEEVYQLEQFRNAETLSLFGLGTVSGINAIQNGSKTQLQRLGIAAGTILGFNSAVGLDAQYAAYLKGRNAVKCVVETDWRLDAAAPAIEVEKMSAQLTERNSEGRLTIKADALTGSVEGRTLMQQITGVPVTSLSTAQIGLAAQVSASINLASASVKDLQVQLDAATAEVTHAANLFSAYNAINDNVGEALHGRTDPAKIMEAMKVSIQKLAGDPVKVATEAAAKAQMAQAQSMLLDLLGANFAQTAAGQRNAALVAGRSVASVQSLVDTYQGCLTDLPPKP